VFSILIYPICLIMFALCVGAVTFLQARGVSHNKILVLAGFLGVLTFLAQYFPPPWYLMEDYEKAYLPAGKAAVGDHAALAQLLSEGVLGFVNLPIVAFLFTPVAVMPFVLGEVVFLAIGALAGVLLWRELAKLLDLKTRESAILLFLAIGSGPAAYNLFLGNTSQSVMLLIVWALAAFINKRDYTAGALFACAALIKPALIIFGVYALLRGRWKVTLSGGIVCVTATLASILIFGWPMHALWLEQTILPALDGTILAHNVQSISGVVGRAIVGPENLLQWVPIHLPDLASAIIRVLQLICAVVIITSLVFLARLNRTEQTAPLEVAFVLMIPLLIPNLSWSHYLIWAFLPIALCLRGMPGLRQATSIQWLALIAAALIAQPIEWWPWFPPIVTEIFGRVIVSLPFVGVVILLSLMVKMTLAIRAGTAETGLIPESDRQTAFSPPLKIPFVTRGAVK